MRILLVDGTNVVMRCASVQTDQPRPSVIASAGRMIRRAADHIGATHLVVAFDAPGHSFRKREYPDYKAHRAERSDETTRWAMEACVAFEADGVFCAFVPDFEADDLLATLAVRAVALPAAADVHILSGDSDLLALSAHPSGCVHCWQFPTQLDEGDAPVVERSPDWICRRYGFQTVSQLTDYKALVGEPGDNVKGVHGVGPVKARALLKTYHTLERIIEFGMIEAGPHALAMRDLITLRTNVPLPAIQPSRCRISRQSPDSERKTA